MSAWDTIRTVVSQLMSDVNQTSVNAFKETPGGTELRMLPEPIMNGAYSIALSGVPQIEVEVNPTIAYLMLVRLQVMFVINQNDRLDPDTELMDSSKSEYTNAVKDVLLIIKTMMLGTYSGLEVKDFSQASGLRMLDDTENYCVCDIEFRLGVREQ